MNKITKPNHLFNGFYLVALTEILLVEARYNAAFHGQNISIENINALLPFMPIYGMKTAYVARGAK